MNSRDLLRFALHYSGIDYAVFPCVRNSKRLACEHGFKDATTDPAQLRNWFANDTLNIGLSASGLLVVDIDHPEHEWCSRDWPAGPVARTPRGGWHRYFKKPQGLEIGNTASTLAPGIDTRTDGGYVVVAPSYVIQPAEIGDDGEVIKPEINGGYEWVYQLCDRENLPVPPPWLIDRIREAARPKSPQPGPSGQRVGQSTGRIIERAREYLRRVPPAVSGQRGHDAAFWAARVLVRGFLFSESDAWTLLIEWNAACSPPWSEKELAHKLKEAREKPFDKPDGWLLNEALPGGLTLPSTSSASWEAVPLPEGQPNEPERPEPPHEFAYHGLLGDYAKRIGGRTEADPIAVLVQSLTLFGNLVGREPRFPIEAKFLRTNLFTLVVGRTSGGRKGTSHSVAEWLFKKSPVLDGIDERWVATRTPQGGLSSGEGLLWQLRDPNTALEDPGEPDKRLCVIEQEVAGVLANFRRDTNNLSPYLRLLADSPEFVSPMTKSNIVGVSKPHFSLVGHIVPHEMRAKVTSLELSNGLMNRILVIYSHSEKCLPHGSGIRDRDIVDYQRQLSVAAGFAQGVGEMCWHPTAVPFWDAMYPILRLRRGLSEMLESLTGRAAAITTRLAMIFALVDRCSEIYPEHLMAATAVWDHAERSLIYLFGDKSGNPLADDIAGLLATSPDGFTRTGISEYLGKHAKSSEIGTALGELLKAGRARIERVPTEGRTAEKWFAVQRPAAVGCATK